jgi:regulator of protease activity HflC (stomatin/prohibitin superfamily)
MNVILAYLLVFVVIVVFFKLIRIVPEQEVYIIEQFGKYKKSLGSGLHLVIPFVQRVAYKHILKEEVIDVDPQVAITADNVQVTVDGLLYLRVMDPEKSSYGIDNYRFATAQLAKTTMRSEIGKLDLDRTFSERDDINDSIVKAVDEASDPWGIKVTRYEIKDISPTDNIEQAMEQQMRAEREKRAEILASEGEKTSRINVSEGDREAAINLSKGERQKRINEAEGKAKAIEITSVATAEGLRLIADALKLPKGKAAMGLRLAEQYIAKFGGILDAAETTVLPDDLARLKSLIDTVAPGIGIGGSGLGGGPGSTGDGASGGLAAAAARRQMSGGTAPGMAGAGGEA